MAWTFANTYYVDVAVGADGNAGTSEGAGNAWATLEKAADTVGANDKVFVKASGSYVAEYNTGGAKDCVLYIITVGAAATSIVWEGYFSTPGDGGIVTIDANTNTLGSAALTALTTDMYNVFKNFYFTGASGAGVDFETTVNADRATFKNCRFGGNATFGVLGDTGFTFFNCLFDNNGTTTAHHGTSTDQGTVFIGCISHTNGGNGYDAFDVFAYKCLEYNNGGKGIHINTAVTCMVLDCTFDGENAASDIGIHQDSATATRNYYINNIFYDYATGITADGGTGEMNISFACLFNSNTDDSSNFITGYDGGDGGRATGDGVGDLMHVIGAANFTSEAGDDYTLNASTSNAIDAGFDCNFVTAFWDSFIAANNPPSV